MTNTPDYAAVKASPDELRKFLHDAYDQIMIVDDCPPPMTEETWREIRRRFLPAGRQTTPVNARRAARKRQRQARAITRRHK